MRNIFVIGAKSLGAYGGYETFINKLTEYHQNDEQLRYHVACKANGDGSMDERKQPDAVPVGKNEFVYHNAHCFKIHVPSIGPAQAIYYDLAALNYCIKYIKKEKIEHPVVYVLACRIGPFFAHYQRQIHKLGGELLVNPDGHEWMRAKWAPPIRKYWKLSERLMIKHCDLAVCDSKNIEKYIKTTYAKYNPKTTFIAYGAEIIPSALAEDEKTYVDWMKQHQLSSKEYYLVVGRFVPENNYETMIREFMRSHSKKDFAIITNVNDKFLNELEEKVHFRKDNRIKFVGTVYNQELLKKIRENAYGYFHGHEVGGTNPSLLEALGSTRLNLLLDVGFNREVAEDAALYWNKSEGNLANLIEQADEMLENEIDCLGEKAKNRIKNNYSWEYIAQRYKNEFLKCARRENHDH